MVWWIWLILFKHMNEVEMVKKPLGSGILRVVDTSYTYED
jgi:hypothetical protein